MSSSLTNRSLFPLLVLPARAKRSEYPAYRPKDGDDDLLLRAEAGDRTAVSLLFDRYAELMLSIGLNVLHDRYEAEDLVQDIFLALFEKIKGFDPAKGSGRTWIIQIAYRRAFDRRAYLARRNFYSGTDLRSAPNTLEVGQGVESQFADRIAGEQLHAAFKDLTEKQRATLELYFFQGLELREISERLGDTLENTRHFYYRGLERLRRAVEAQQYRGKQRP